jgi:hypothetical protein
MSNGDEWYQRPTSIVAIGVAAGIVLLAFGWLLKLVIPAIGAAIGIAATIIGGGIVGSGAVASWVVPAAGAGIALVGGAGGLIILVKVIEKASNSPYEWIMPILAILSAFIIDLSKEIYQADEIVRLAFGTATTAVFFVGGLLWKKKRISNRILGTILYLLPPSLVLAQSIHGKPGSLKEILANVPFHTWMTIGGLLLILILVAGLSFVLKDEK